MLGDAMGLAINLFERSKVDERVLIVLTDGNDTGSVVPPIDAAIVAAARNIRIYPIAIGDPASAGNEAIDQRTLDRVAEVTGGRSFTALDRQALNEAFTLLAELEPSVFERLSFRPKTDLHWLPIVAVLLLYLLLRGLAATLFGKKVIAPEEPT